MSYQQKVAQHKGKTNGFLSPIFGVQLLQAFQKKQTDLEDC